jgi:hypothetical protein
VLFGSAQLWSWGSWEFLVVKLSVRMVELFFFTTKNPQLAEVLMRGHLNAFGKQPVALA